MGAGRFSVDTVFNAKDGMSGTISKMESRATRFEKSLGGANRIADGGAAGMAKLATGAAVAGAAAGAVFADIISTGADFEQTMIGAAAKFSPAIRQGTKEFEELRITAEKIGASTEFNAQQAASGLKDLASAGFTTKQAILALPGVVDLATASEVGLAEASNMASKSLGAFNLKTDDAVQLGKNLSRVNDVMSRTADATSASMDGLFQSILEGGPVATTAGASVETFMALAGQLAQSGIEASVAGTTLKNVFLTLAAPTKEAAAALKKLDIKTEVNGNMRDAVAILGDLEKKTAKMGTADRAGALESIFGKIPIAGVSALLSGGIDKVEDLRTKLQDAGGSTARMAAIMRDSTKNDIDGFTSAIDGVKIAIFGVVKAPFRQLTQDITDWTTANQGLIASGVDQFLKDAKPLLDNFGDGVRDAFTDAKPLIEGVGGALSGVFGAGAGGARIQAYELGNNIATAAIRFGEFWLITKAISAATAVYSFVLGTARTAMLAYEAATIAVKWAIASYQIWTKAGTAATIAMSGANVIAAGSLLQTRVAAFAAAGGFRALAGAAGLATVAYLAYAAVQEQNDALKKENAGLGILDLTWGAISEGKGFSTQVDEKMNREARAEREKKNRERNGPLQALDTGESSGGMDLNQLNSLAAAGNFEALSKQLAALDKASGQLPPTNGPVPVDAAGAPLAPGVPAAAPASKDPPVVSLKEDSTAKLSQDMGAAVKGALKGVLTIEIKDKGKNVSSVETNGSDVMSIDPSGSF
jgi:TP901 family phage tail tape measure protein